MKTAPATAPPRTVYRVQYDRTRWLSWVVVVEGGTPYAFETKIAAVDAARAMAIANQPSQVVIHKRDGKIQREMTFPRSSDPRRSKG